MSGKITILCALMLGIYVQTFSTVNGKSIANATTASLHEVRYNLIHNDLNEIAEVIDKEDSLDEHHASVLCEELKRIRDKFDEYRKIAEKECCLPVCLKEFTKDKKHFFKLFYEAKGKLLKKCKKGATCKFDPKQDQHEHKKDHEEQKKDNHEDDHHDSSDDNDNDSDENYKESNNDDDSDSDDSDDSDSESPESDASKSDDDDSSTSW